MQINKTVTFLKLKTSYFLIKCVIMRKIFRNTFRLYNNVFTAPDEKKTLTLPRT